MKIDFISETLKKDLNANLGSFGSFLYALIKLVNMSIVGISLVLLFGNVGVPIWTILPIGIYPFLHDFSVCAEIPMYVSGLVVVLSGGLETSAIVQFWICFAIWLIRFIFLILSIISRFRYNKALSSHGEYYTEKKNRKSKNIKRSKV